MAIIMNWISLHIYYSNNKDRLIKQGLIPTIELMLNEELISSYFFIFYQEKGTHLRLRVKSHFSEETIFETVNSIMSEYFRLHPSEIDLTRNPDFYPNDSIQLIPYEQEYDRYGGTIGMIISQRQFQYSTKVAFKYFNKTEIYSYNAFLNVAIKLHLTTAFILCKDLNNTIFFFNFLFNNVSKNFSSGQIKFTNNIEIYYSQYFLQQRNSIVRFVQSVWYALENNYFIDDETQEWKTNEIEILELLNEAYNKNELIPPFIFECYPLWSIYQSYIHMTNNRLGIATIDEPLIAYLILRSLKEKIIVNY